MENLKEALEKMISSYERHKQEAAIQAAISEAERDCLATFILELKDLLSKCKEG